MCFFVGGSVGDISFYVTSLELCMLFHEGRNCFIYDYMAHIVIEEARCRQFMGYSFR